MTRSSGFAAVGIGGVCLFALAAVVVYPFSQPPIPARQLLVGEEVVTAFELCPDNDVGWDPESDFLGTVMCGEVYSIRYDFLGKAWHVSGPNEADRAADPNAENRHDIVAGPPPTEGRFPVQGHWFSFSEFGAVYLENGTLVGSLRVRP